MSFFQQALAERRAENQGTAATRIVKAAPALRLSDDAFKTLVDAAIAKAIGARPVVVPTNAGDPVQAPASFGDAIRQHINSQRRVGETNAAATLRLSTEGDQVLNGLYQAGKMAKGSNTALTNAHAAAADAVPVAKANRTIEAATDVAIAKAATEGRVMSRHAALRVALDADPSLYDAHRTAHRAARNFL